MKKVRWGLISTANINRKLIPAIRAAERGTLAAVASRDIEKAKAYARQWDIPQAFGSYQEMLDSGKVDAVYISLPNYLHAEWSIKAMQAGVNVLCEKPFGISMEEVDAMIAASQKTGKVLMEGFMYRHHPQTKLIGEWVRSGKLGRIVLVRGNFSFKLTNPKDVRMIPEYGGGALWDIGVYPLSFAQYIYGCAPIAVSAMQYLGETGIDETFVGHAVYPGNGYAEISCSFRTPFHTSIEVLGEEGQLTLTRPFTYVDNNRLTFIPNEGEPQEIEVEKKELYLGEIENMNAAILDGQPQYLTLAETRDHIRTALALYEAARTGSDVLLDQPRWR